MTASDMEALFSPVPFGVARPSAFAQITQSDAAPVWDLFRNVDEDKQNTALRVRCRHTSNTAKALHHSQGSA